MRVFLILMVSILFVSPSEAANKYTYIRTLSYDTSYYPYSLNSKRGITDFNIEYMGLLPAGVFDLGSLLIPDKAWFIRLFYLAAWEYLFYSNEFHWPLFLANHEFGHGQVGIALGLRPEYYFSTPTEEIGPYYNYFSYLFAAHFRSKTGGSTFYGGYFGGLNQSMYLAEQISERIYYYNGHVAMLPYYIASKLDLKSYLDTVAGTSTGDFTFIDNYYRSMGFDITHNDMRLGSLISLFASATTYAFIFKNRYISEGDPAVYPLELGNIRLPDLSYYLVGSGVSYKISSGFRWGKNPTITIPFSYEQVFEGNYQSDIISGVHFDYEKYKWGVEGILGFGTPHGIRQGAKIFGEIFLTKRLLLSGGVEAFDMLTLHGERNAFRMSVPRSYELWLKASCVL